MSNSIWYILDSALALVDVNGKRSVKFQGKKQAIRFPIFKNPLAGVELTIELFDARGSIADDASKCGAHLLYRDLGFSTRTDPKRRDGVFCPFNYVRGVA